MARNLKHNYFFIGLIIYNKAVILVAVHFSMQNIELLCDLGRTLGWG